VRRRSFDAAAAPGEGESGLPSSLPAMVIARVVIARVDA
jgi:hypothetical protein